jgi:SH3-like domain-containing protein
MMTLLIDMNYFAINKRAVLVWGIFFIFLLFFACAANAKMVSIANKKVNLRSGPGKKYAVVWELDKGFPFKVIDTKGNWYKVQDFENDTGWVHKRMVSAKAHLIVKKKRVNIRSAASKRARLIGKADYGVVFRTLEFRKGWVKVKHENGLTGWVRRNLLWGW